MNSPATTRRTFLKQTTAAGAAAASLSLARGAHAAADGTIKVGMIGCGGRCSGAAHQALQAGKDVKLVAMTDIFEDRARGARERLKSRLPDQIDVSDENLHWDFEGYKKVIDASDVVLIACASKFHPIYAEAAITAGKHVFVEKPHGIDPIGVRRMQAACDLAARKGLSIVSGLHSRFDKCWRETVKRLQDGAIGDITAIQSMYLRGPYQLVKRDPKLSETEYQFSNWYHFRWLSGDDVTQSLVHNLDRCLWILGEEKPEWCFGLGGRSASFGDEYGDMYDHNTVVYEYPERDGKPSRRIYALCRTQNGCYGNGSDILMGTKGTCYLSRNRIVGENEWQYRGPRGNAYQEEQNALIESVREGKPLNCGSYMAGSTMMGVMGQLAVYTGAKTNWTDIDQAQVRFGPAPEESSFKTPPPSTPDATGNYPLPMPGITQLSNFAVK
jgi:myo-inositol 2-dehydrogenase/D-chiro-inositol 1-dehydrogenase